MPKKWWLQRQIAKIERKAKRNPRKARHLMPKYWGKVHELQTLEMRKGDLYNAESEQASKETVRQMDFRESC